MRDLYLIKGYLTGVVEIPWEALILRGDSLVPVILAMNLDGDELLTQWLKRHNYPFNREIKVHLHDLPLYINWPYKTPEFLALLKAGCND